MALIRIIYEISNKSYILLNDLGMSSEKNFICYGLQKSADKYCYDDGIFEDVHNVDNWGPNEDFWALRFQSIIAGVYDITKTRYESFKFLFTEVSKFEKFIEDKKMLVAKKNTKTLFADINKYVDLNLSNKKYDNSNIDSRWVKNYSSTNIQLGVTASVLHRVREIETFT